MADLIRPYRPDLSFLSGFPYGPRSEIEDLFALRHGMVCGGWQSAWQGVASMCIELREICIKHQVPELFDRVLTAVGPGAGELRVMMRAKGYLEDPRLDAVIGDRISPVQICGAVDAYKQQQSSLPLEEVTKYDVNTSVSDLSFDTLGSDDVLKASPNVAGVTGENAIQVILEALKIPFTAQYPNAYPCDFGEGKRPDFKVGTVKAQADSRLARGFYIEIATRLNYRDKDLGLFYLLHQIVQYADLPTIVVYDAPVISERVQGWAHRFEEKHRSGNRLFAVRTHQQFREWAIRKLGSQK